MAKHALVLGSSEPVSSDSIQAPSGARRGDATLQRGTTQESQQPHLHAWLLESLPSRNTGSLMKWQQELRLLREAQP